MLSVVIDTLNDAEALARLLTALVPAAVDGLVVEVIVRDGGSADGTAEIALDCGAKVIAAGAPLAAARGDWLCVLPVGARLAQGWMESVAGHLDAAPAPARLVSVKAGWFAPRGKAPVGWLAPTSAASLARLVEGRLGDLANRGARRLEVFTRD